MVLSCSDKVLDLKKNGKMLKSIDLKNISVTSEYTLSQLQQYKDAKAELNCKILNGDLSIKIKYYTGEPKIILLAQLFL